MAARNFSFILNSPQHWVLCKALNPFSQGAFLYTGDWFVHSKLVATGALNVISIFFESTKIFYWKQNRPKHTVDVLREQNNQEPKLQRSCKSEIAEDENVCKAKLHLSKVWKKKDLILCIECLHFQSFSHSTPPKYTTLCNVHKPPQSYIGISAELVLPWT